MNYKVEAIVLKSRDIKEVDRVYTIFSREKGKLKIVGKGTRKPTAKLASAMEPITLSEVFLIAGKWLDKLTGVILVQQYPRIKSDEKKLLLCKRLFEILDALANEKEPNQQLYQELIDFLSLLESPSVDYQLLRLMQLGLLWKIIQWSGHQPEVFCCAHCAQSLQEKEFYWFGVDTGIECEKCHFGQGRKIRIEKDTVKILRIFFSQPLSIILKLRVKEKNILQVSKTIEMILQHILGKRVYL